MVRFGFELAGVPKRGVLLVLIVLFCKLVKVRSETFAEEGY